MKHLVFIICCVGSMLAFSSDDKSWTPIQVNVLSPVGIPWGFDSNVYGLRLGLLTNISKTGDCYGLDVSPLNFCKDFTGIGVGLFNRGYNTQNGVLIGAANRADADSFGLGVSLCNVSSGDCGGLYVAIANFNYQSFNGVGVGFINEAVDMNGVQLGSVNAAKHMNGVQLSDWANTSDSISGVQIGLVNFAKRMNGLQIGILNFIDNGIVPCFPLLNFSASR